jgi:hypothetical protein
MYLSKDKGIPKDNEKAFGSGSMMTETSNGESHTRRVRWMELRSGLINKETSNGESHTKREGGWDWRVV